MKRREFIIQGVSAGLVAGAAGGIGNLVDFASASPVPEIWDLVAVRDGEPGIMFDRAIASLGGMSKYVKKGQKVVVKPNIGWDVPPERAGNTNPGLVARIIRHCLDAGASDVYVFDNTCDEWNLCYKNSGIEKAVKDAGGKIVPGNTEGYYQTVKIPRGRKLKEAKVHELILTSDVFINVPVLKHHSSASLSLAMKNLMGVVWDRGYWHRNDLHQCIADFVSWRKPTLNVIDGYRVMMRNGPRGVSTADVVTMKQMIVSADIVAADTAATKIFGSNPEDIRHIMIAGEMKLGITALDKLKINRIKI
ncbi:MAG: DUF362 domain-containing protein [Bacteroidales bacterium]|nr:DUF362 domain-containing protein [Bacteroidales bacterium]MBK9357247.1 DUF362 domain-containing protein [Bacteroidales bacterium]